MANANSQRRWTVPTKRAKGYAADRRAKVHTYGPKEDEPLTDFEAGLRSGYLQCQTDHAGMYKYKKAIAEGKTPQEAMEQMRIHVNRLLPKFCQVSSVELVSEEFEKTPKRSIKRYLYK